MRYLGLDLGTKTLGVAVSDLTGTIATSLTILRHDNNHSYLIEELKKNYTIVIVTHNMQQAARISDDTAFFLNGVLVEHNETKTMFTSPQDKRTEDYITGRFG